MGKELLPDINKFTVKEGNKSMEVFIPKTGDAVEDAYMEAAEREKTSEELKKTPDKPRATAKDKENLAGVAKELLEWRERKRKGSGNKKYY